MHKEFDIGVATEEQIDQCNSVAKLFDEFLTSLGDLCHDCREFSIARTKLEEACFFAKKSIFNRTISYVNVTIIGGEYRADEER